MHTDVYWCPWDVRVSVLDGRWAGTEGGVDGQVGDGLEPLLLEVCHLAVCGATQALAGQAPAFQRTDSATSNLSRVLSGSLEDSASHVRYTALVSHMPVPATENVHRQVRRGKPLCCCAALTIAGDLVVAGRRGAEAAVGSAEGDAAPGGGRPPGGAHCPASRGDRPPGPAATGSAPGMVRVPSLSLPSPPVCWQ